MLGLTDDELIAYREMLLRPSCSRTELAEALDVPEDQTARLLRRLEQLGLAARSGESPGRLTASPPGLAMGALLTERQNELKLAEIELSSLEELYRTGVTQRAEAEVVEVVRGADAIRQRFAQLQSGARREVLCFVQAPLQLVAIDENSVEAPTAARGVAYRVVWDQQILDDDPSMLDHLEQAAAGGEEVRLIDRVPLKLIAADRELALIPIVSSSAPAAESALLIRPSALLDALLALFELVWQRASRIVVTTEGLSHGSGPDVLDAVDARILGLLTAGFNDQAVASRLALSLRTVQRRVRALMELTGARTRLQLGVHAARLTDSPAPGCTPAVPDAPPN
ncbi:helix-turn-helix domain-containing protein [Streptomyces sp. NPDC055092]